MTYVICFQVVQKILFINRFHTFDREDGHLDKHRFNEQFFKERIDGESKNEEVTDIERDSRQATWREWYSRWFDKAVESTRRTFKRKTHKGV